VFAGATRGSDQIDLSGPVLQAPGAEAAVLIAATISFGTTLIVHAAIEAGAPVGLHARSLIVEHQA
jgi:hypothetical protein